MHSHGGGGGGRCAVGEGPLPMSPRIMAGFRLRARKGSGAAARAPVRQAPASLAPWLCGGAFMPPWLYQLYRSGGGMRPEMDAPRVNSGLMGKQPEPTLTQEGGGGWPRALESCPPTGHRTCGHQPLWEGLWTSGTKGLRIVFPQDEARDTEGGSLRLMRNGQASS